MNKHIYIGLGSNIEPREDYIKQAIEKIAVKNTIVACADLLESEPMGFEADTNFINTVIEIETEMSPRELLICLKEIEKELGRKSKSKNGVYSSRTIDLDILYFDNQTLISPELVIPHPELANRSFVLIPLSQIAPNFKDPLHLLTVETLLSKLMKG